jgi:O-antigen/teichoic acid export membrane protein
LKVNYIYPYAYFKKVVTDNSFRHLFKHSVNYGLGDVISQVIGFLLIPLYTTFLSSSDYGIVDLVGTICAFAIPIIKLGLPGSVTRQYFDYHNDPAKLADYITTIYKLLNWAALIVGSILLVIIFFIKDLIFSEIQFWPYLVLPILTAGLGANNQLMQKVVQNEEKSKYAVKIRLIFTFSSIAMSILFIAGFKLGALGFIIADLIIAIAFFIQAYFFLKPYIKGKFNLTMAKEGLRYGSGILPSHVFMASSPLLSKAILVNLGSLSALGVFSIGTRFVLPLEIFYSMISTAFTPIYNRLRTENRNNEVAKYIKIILVGSFLLFALLLFFGPPIMRLMLPSNYHGSIALIPILAIGFIFKITYLLNSLEIYYVRKTRFVSIIPFVGLTINIFICLFFVTGYQEKAIAWAYSINYLVWFGLAYLYKRKVSAQSMFLKEYSLFIFTAILLVIFSHLIYYQFY